MSLNLATQLKNDDLTYAGVIRLVEHSIVVAEVTNLLHSKPGGAYAWVAINKNGQPARVVYVGRYTKTLVARCKQHTNGFRDIGGSPTGKKNAKKIRALINDEKLSLAIYALHSHYSKQIEYRLMHKYYGKHPSALWNVSGMRIIAREKGYR